MTNMVARSGRMGTHMQSQRGEKARHAVGNPKTQYTMFGAKFPHVRERREREEVVRPVFCVRFAEIRR